MLTSHRTNTILLVLILAVGVGILAMLATGVRGGPLDPPGPVASTQSNVIYQPASCAAFPIVLSAPGSYRLGSNITGCNAKDGIQITTSNVTLDLGGFSVTAGFGSLYGIRSIGANSHLSIVNGIVGSWQRGLSLEESSIIRVDNIIATNNTTGIFIGGDSVVSNSTVSFSGIVGITTPSEASNVTIRDCHVNNTNGAGMLLNGPRATIDSCKIANNVGDGITITGFNASILNNQVDNNGANGINCNSQCSIENNRANDNGAHGIMADSACHIENNSASYNAQHGIYVYGQRCIVVRNSVFNNTQDGVSVAGSLTLIDSNYASGNNQGFFVANPPAGFPNIITRNTSKTNLTNYWFAGGGVNNDIPQITIASLITSPLANISCC